MAKCGLLLSLLVLSSLACLRAERINSISTKTSDCLFCGMVEGVGYLTVKVSGGGGDEGDVNVDDVMMPGLW